ncbi:MAG TPA: hypothetical protein VM490_07940 [Armatimonadaceae bacterium]|nr:hypothetical protein [Armatimonadaceae bacterium]
MRSSLPLSAAVAALIALTGVTALAQQKQAPKKPQAAPPAGEKPKPRGAASPVTVRERPAAKPAAAAPDAVPPAGAYQQGKLLVNLEATIVGESSGVAASRLNPGVLWTHNDSGDGAYLYGIDRRGRAAGVYLVRSAAAVDWEDIAWGPGPEGKGNFLYIGDIGDYYKNRTDTCVYRIPEPRLSANGGRVGTKSNPLLTSEPTVRLMYRYPDGFHNAEALLVHPKTGVIYLVTKDESGTSGVYRFPKETGNHFAQYTLEKVGTLTFANETHPFPNLVTGGDIAPDGRRVILRTYFAAYEWRLPDGVRDFDAIWGTTPALVPAPFTQQGEAICYRADGKALLATSEKLPTPLYEIRAK